MKEQVICTEGNILVKEFKDTESESGIILGEENNEPYSLYEILDINGTTASDLEALLQEKDKKAKLEDCLLLYSGFARIPITKDKFIVHVKDCLGVVKKDKYKELISD